MSRYALLQPLTLNRTHYPTGSTVELSDAQARWLIGQGVVARDGAPIKREQPVSAVLRPQRAAARCCGWR